jgi:hypothetical protein
MLSKDLPVFPEGRGGFDKDFSSLEYLKWIEGFGGGDGNKEGGEGGYNEKKKGGKDNLYVCNVGEGEGIFIPDGWWHSTLNTGEWNSFLSAFV